MGLPELLSLHAVMASPIAAKKETPATRVSVFMRNLLGAPAARAVANGDVYFASTNWCVFE